VSTLPTATFSSSISSCTTPSPGTPGEGWGEGDFEHQRPATLKITLTPALSRSTGRGGKPSDPQSWLRCREALVSCYVDSYFLGFPSAEAS
jgi:hypothetical protein